MKHTSTELECSYCAQTVEEDSLDFHFLNDADYKLFKMGDRTVPIFCSEKCLEKFILGFSHSEFKRKQTLKQNKEVLMK